VFPDEVMTWGMFGTAIRGLTDFVVSVLWTSTNFIIAENMVGVIRPVEQRPTYGSFVRIEFSCANRRADFHVDVDGMGVR